MYLKQNSALSTLNFSQFYDPVEITSQNSIIALSSKQKVMQMFLTDLSK